MYMYMYIWYSVLQVTKIGSIVQSVLHLHVHETPLTCKLLIRLECTCTVHVHVCV